MSDFVGGSWVPGILSLVIRRCAVESPGMVGPAPAYVGPWPRSQHLPAVSFWRRWRVSDAWLELRSSRHSSLGWHAHHRCVGALHLPRFFAPNSHRGAAHCCNEPASANVYEPIIAYSTYMGLITHHGAEAGLCAQLCQQSDPADAELSETS